MTDSEITQAIPDHRPVLSAAPGSEFEFAETPRHTSAHWWLLAISTTVMVASFVMSSHGEETVLVPFIGEELPEICFTRRVFRIDCPGCGLTRSFVNIAHGNFARSLHFNPAGVLMFALIAFQIPFRILQIVRINTGRERLVFPYWEWIFYGIVAVMVAQWAIKLFW